ncbi:MAG: recombinase zinc beta ribbon domain-containing protein [Ignavibacteriae bacterium]|nr:recombinase zinc beta ribbon domain-containing protein [Ignavibacteria bacterium]MBI3364746.1 recombinase zinc beta ribbon domain-containing protein [Ignavibacteriota bacterium]
MRCNRCGFNYQGQSSEIRGTRYYRYVCGGYNSKRVCPSCAVNRDLVESFVIKCVKDVISDTNVVEKIEEELMNLIREEPGFRQSEIDDTNRLIVEVEKKIKNLTHVLERGVQLDSIIARLKEVENVRKILLEKKEKIGSRSDQKPFHAEEISTAISTFLTNFEKEIAEAPLADKRILVQRCISQIEVDPETRKVQVYVRKLPVINSQIERYYNQFEETGKSRGRVFSNTKVPGAGLEPVRPCGH